jgi:hypothetical protein
MPALTVKGDGFGKFQSPRNQEVINQIKCTSSIEA